MIGVELLIKASYSENDITSITSCYINNCEIDCTFFSVDIITRLIIKFGSNMFGLFFPTYYAVIYKTIHDLLKNSCN